jgi:predicted nucleic acid-binding protein
VTVVLDCSATLAWLYSDETTPAILAVFDQVVLRGAVVPELWRIEIANGLTMGIRRSRITATERSASLADLADLPIAVDDKASEQVWGKTLELTDKHNLTVYDAIYLELALRRSLPLATLDIELRRAATAEGVPLLGI